MAKATEVASMVRPLKEETCARDGRVYCAGEEGKACVGWHAAELREKATRVQ